MKRSSCLVSALTWVLLATVTAGAAAASAGATGAISGTVVDQDGQPLVATVVLHPEGRETRTDAAGAFELTGVAFLM